MLPVYNWRNQVEKYTSLHPVVTKLADKYRVFLSLNKGATEWRYEAMGRDANGALCLACDEDPNRAVLDCVSQVRGRAPYLGG